VEEASPQLENGYTRLANELLDALVGAGLTARQWAVVMAVIRKTYGYNKTRDDIGLTQLRLMTGIDKSHLSRTIRELEGMKLLHRQVGTHSHTLGINKRHKEWELPNQQPRLPKEQQLPKEQPGVAESATLGVAELAIEGLPKEQPQKTSIKDKVKTTPKDTLSRSLRERFDVFWAAYPKKKSKDAAEKAFAKRKPDEQLFADIMSALERATTSVDWLKDGGAFVPHPATWLNAGGWMDEYTAASYSPEEIAVIDAYNVAMPDAWARAVAAPFVAARSAAIRDFLAIAPTKPDMPKNYFAHCAANLAVDERCGFDWLIRKETYLRVREGAVKHKETT
jgi:phage replication O-like protein O